MVSILLGFILGFATLSYEATWILLKPLLCVLQGPVKPPIPFPPSLVRSSHSSQLPEKIKNDYFHLPPSRERGGDKSPKGKEEQKNLGFGTGSCMHAHNTEYESEDDIHLYFLKVKISIDCETPLFLEQDIPHYVNCSR